MTSTPNAEVHTLAGAYVVNALSDTERRVFERHLAECADCSAEVSGLREVVAVFGASVAEPPPAHLRAQVLAKTAVTRRLPPVVAGREQPRKRVPGRWLAAAAAVVLVAVALGGVVFGYRATTTSNEANRQLVELEQTRGNYSDLTDLLAQPDAKLLRQPIEGGVATVVYSPSKHTAAMLGADMPDAPDQHAYQGWLIRDASPQSVGLSPGGKEGGAMLAHDVVPGDQLAVTVEPAGGSVKPTTPAVVTVTLV